jgi:DNA-binding response OmpR family regulator
MPSGTALLITPERLPDPATVVMGLARRDLTVVWASTAAESLQQVPLEAPQVIVLDLAVGGASADSGGVGAQLCQRLRFLTQAPILVLATPQDKPAILRALGLGADAFLFKPVTPDLLVGAIAALRRRPTLEEEELPEVIEMRDMEVDRERCEARLRGEPVPLTPTEFRILNCLARNVGRVVSARQLLQEAQGYPCTEREAQQIVKVHVRHLRTKLEPPPGERSYIANVRGFGYVLERRAALRPDDLVAILEEPDAD